MEKNHQSSPLAWIPLSLVRDHCLQKTLMMATQEPYPPSHCARPTNTCFIKMHHPCGPPKDQSNYKTSNIKSIKLFSATVPISYLHLNSPQQNLNKCQNNLLLVLTCYHQHPEDGSCQALQGCHSWEVSLEAALPWTPYEDDLEGQPHQVVPLGSP